MAINEAANGGVLVLSCKYCGTQSRFKINEFAGDEPLTCRAGGAALEAAPPPQARAKRKKFKRAFGRLTDDPVRGEYWRERRTDYVTRVAKGIAWIIISAAQLVFALLLIAHIKCD